MAMLFVVLVAYVLLWRCRLFYWSYINIPFRDCSNRKLVDTMGLTGAHHC